MSVQSASPAAPLLTPALKLRPARVALWHNRSIRVQLLLAFALIDLVTVLVAGSLAILRARTQVRVEIAASMRLAELLVGDAANFVHQEVPAEQFLATLPRQLRSLRHVRIEVRDDSGMALPRPPGPAASEHAPAPAWFIALVAPSIQSHLVPVVADGRKVGQVEIIGEPADEIAEIWQNLVAMATVAAALNLGMIGILYVLFGRVLDPLTALAAGLSDLERQSDGVRLPRPQARELASIADQFNALARALETARTENRDLNRRLITAQDDERRRTALDLHDEVGPCLFGLKAYASSIATAAGELPGQAGQTVLQSSREILAMIEHLQAINRSMLERLRPMALSHVPLTDILGQLVHQRAHQHRQIGFDFKAGPLARGYGDSIDLTIYRCVQEGLTNAARHAQARHVTVELCHDAGAALLTLTIRDDGRGIAAGTPPGFGIRGMRERVEGLGGRYRITGDPGRGTCVHITIPTAQPQHSGPEAAWAGEAPA
jgi:two-component system, NarL family, sensor histidine kinase UhpB